MKAVYSLLAILFCFSIESKAQVPQAIPYQAAARNSTGALVSNQNISLRFGIYPSLTGGILLYQETHSVTTNTLGLFTANIGQGVVISGAFSSIDWSSGSKYLEVELDVNGGSNYTTMGRTQMLSVPYSLFSEKTSGLPNGSSAGQILIWDGLQWVAGSVCTLFNTDPNNCGSCNNVCPPNVPNGTSACVNGVCTVNCNVGFGNCDGIAANGCEVNLNSNTANCGICGASCPARSNAVSICVSGICSFICNTGFADCNNNPTDGCEVNLTADAVNCGACGNVCAAGQSCVGGVCTSVCPAGQTLCSGICRNLQTDVANCGMCGAVCPAVANAVSICVSGSCSFICNAGFADCNNNPSDGCEVNLTTSPSNCGACGNVCPAGQSCVGGVCTLVCPGGQTNCGGICKNLLTDPANCGGCGNTCGNPPNAAAVCNSGACSLICNSGFANCNGVYADGCEVNITTNTSNCGGCGIVCPVRANSTNICVSGVCSIICNPGFANCNGNATDGCEVNLLTSNNNCGSCGHVCPGTQNCLNGVCQ